MEYNLNEPIAERKTKTVYRDGNKTIKLFIENYSKAAILNEALIQARVEEKTDLNMSRLLEVTKIENRWALVTEFIEGTPLDVLMREHPERQEDRRQHEHGYVDRNFCSRSCDDRVRPHQEKNCKIGCHIQSRQEKTGRKSRKGGLPAFFFFPLAKGKKRKVEERKGKR